MYKRCFSRAKKIEKLIFYLILYQKTYPLEPDNIIRLGKGSLHELIIWPLICRIFQHSQK